MRLAKKVNKNLKSNDAITVSKVAKKEGEEIPKAALSGFLAKRKRLLPNLLTTSLFCL
jgi:hypothetical protein